MTGANNLTVTAEDAATNAGTLVSALIAGHVTDIDAGDVLSYSASLVDGFDLPDWLSFDESTQAFSGTTPSDATGQRCPAATRAST